MAAQHEDQPAGQLSRVRVLHLPELSDVNRRSGRDALLPTMRSAGPALRGVHHTPCEDSLTGSRVRRTGRRASLSSAKAWTAPASPEAIAWSGQHQRDLLERVAAIDEESSVRD